MERRHSEQTRQLLDALAAAKTTPKPVEVEVRTGPVEVEVEPVEEGMHAAALALAPVPAKPRALSIPERMALDDQKHATMIMQKVQRGKAERSKIARSQWRRAFTAAKEMAKAEKQVSPQPVKERPPRLRGDGLASPTGSTSSLPLSPPKTEMPEPLPVAEAPRALSIPERMALDDQKHATMILQKVQRGHSERSKIARSQWRRAFTAAKEMAKAEKQVSPQPVKERPPRLRGEENAATTGPPSPNPMAPAATPPTAAPLLTRIAPAPAPTAAATELKKLPMESVRSTAETGGVGVLSPKGEKPIIPKTKVFL